MTLLLAMTRNALVLAAFALVTVGGVAGTRWLTADAVAAREAESRQRALAAILPPTSDGRLVRVEMPAVAALGLREPRPAWVLARDADALAAVLPVVAPDGYSGAIEMLLAVRADGTVSGVRVVDHRETPGLGDAIERRKSDWITRFRGRRLGAPPASAWTLERDGGAFDALTGATITSRAVVTAIRRALVWFEGGGRARLFSAVRPDETPKTGAASG